MRRRLLDRVLTPARVVSVERTGPRLRLVTLTGPALCDLTWLPGQHVRVQVAASPSGVDWLVGIPRTYTVWDLDDQNLQLIVFDHGEGPGAAWARTAQPGDEVMFLKPQGSFVTAPAAYHLFVGEETAQVAFGPMMRSLPAGSRIFARLEVDGPGERLELRPVLSGSTDGPVLTAWDLDWQYRHGRPAASAQSLVEAVRDLDLPAEPGRAYLAGEARTIQMVRRHLVEDRGWPRRNVSTKPFWAPGRKGLD